MWCSVGNSKKDPIAQLCQIDLQLTDENKSGAKNERADCRNVSKGVFLGLVTLSTAIIALVIFYVMKVKQGENFDRKEIHSSTRVCVEYVGIRPRPLLAVFWNSSCPSRLFNAPGCCRIDSDSQVDDVA